MLEIICAGSLVLSFNVCQSHDFVGFAWGKNLDISHTSQLNISLEQEYLAKGKPYQSEYRREADRSGPRHEIRYRGRHHEGRIYRDADEHRRNRDYYRDDNRRIYRDGEKYRRDAEYEQEVKDDRYYRRSRSRNRYIRSNDYYRH